MPQTQIAALQYEVLNAMSGNGVANRHRRKTDQLRLGAGLHRFSSHALPSQVAVQALELIYKLHSNFKVH
jgi:hypothetical protein